MTKTVPEKASYSETADTLPPESNDASQSSSAALNNGVDHVGHSDSCAVSQPQKFSISYKTDSGLVPTKSLSTSHDVGRIDSQGTYKGSNGQYVSDGTFIEEVMRTSLKEASNNAKSSIQTSFATTHSGSFWNQSFIEHHDETFQVSVGPNVKYSTTSEARAEIPPENMSLPKVEARSLHAGNAGVDIFSTKLIWPQRFMDMTTKATLFDASLISRWNVKLDPNDPDRILDIALGAHVALLKLELLTNMFNNGQYGKLGHSITGYLGGLGAGFSLELRKNPNGNIFCRLGTEFIYGSGTQEKIGFEIPVERYKTALASLFAHFQNNTPKNTKTPSPSSVGVLPQELVTINVKFTPSKNGGELSFLYPKAPGQFGTLRVVQLTAAQQVPVTHNYYKAAFIPTSHANQLTNDCRENPTSEVFADSASHPTDPLQVNFAANLSFSNNQSVLSATGSVSRGDNTFSTTLWGTLAGSSGLSIAIAGSNPFGVGLVATGLFVGAGYTIARDLRQQKLSNALPGFDSSLKHVQNLKNALFTAQSIKVLSATDRNDVIRAVEEALGQEHDSNNLAILQNMRGHLTWAGGNPTGEWIKGNYEPSKGIYIHGVQESLAEIERYTENGNRAKAFLVAQKLESVSGHNLDVKRACTRLLSPERQHQKCQQILAELPSEEAYENIKQRYEGSIPYELTYQCAMKAGSEKNEAFCINLLTKLQQQLAGVSVRNHQENKLFKNVNGRIALATADSDPVSFSRNALELITDSDVDTNVRSYLHLKLGSLPNTSSEARLTHFATANELLPQDGLIADCYARQLSQNFEYTKAYEVLDKIPEKSCFNPLTRVSIQLHENSTHRFALAVGSTVFNYLANVTCNSQYCPSIVAKTIGVVQTGEKFVTPSVSAYLQYQHTQLLKQHNKATFKNPSHLRYSNGLHDFADGLMLAGLAFQGASLFFSPDSTTHRYLGHAAVAADVTQNIAQSTAMSVDIYNSSQALSYPDYCLGGLGIGRSFIRVVRVGIDYCSQEGKAGYKPTDLFGVTIDTTDKLINNSAVSLGLFGFTYAATIKATAATVASAVVKTKAATAAATVATAVMKTKAAATVATAATSAVNSTAAAAVSAKLAVAAKATAVMATGPIGVSIAAGALTAGAFWAWDNRWYNNNLDNAKKAYNSALENPVNARKPLQQGLEYGRNILSYYPDDEPTQEVYRTLFVTHFLMTTASMVAYSDAEKEQIRNGMHILMGSNSLASTKAGTLATNLTMQAKQYQKSVEEDRRLKHSAETPFGFFNHFRNVIRQSVNSSSSTKAGQTFIPSSIRNYK